jgi:beta-xylosidase
VSKFKYLLFPEHKYIVTLKDFDGNQFTIEITGEDILEILSAKYASEMLSKSLIQKLEEMPFDKIESEWENSSYE